MSGPSRTAVSRCAPTPLQPAPACSCSPHKQSPAPWRWIRPCLALPSVATGPCCLMRWAVQRPLRCVCGGVWGAQNLKHLGNFLVHPMTTCSAAVLNLRPCLASAIAAAWPVCACTRNVCARKIPLRTQQHPPAPHVVLNLCPGSWFVVAAAGEHPQPVHDVAAGHAGDNVHLLQAVGRD